VYEEIMGVQEEISTEEISTGPKNEAQPIC